MNGYCDLCTRPGRLAKCVCQGHHYDAGVWVCPVHEGALAGGDLFCTECFYHGSAPERHLCVLVEVPA